ncbi:MAG: site-2 protease family protein [Candidatus Diapherotrites archaeon]
MESRERNDLIISWLTISLGFAWVLSEFLNFGDFGEKLPIALVGVGTGFILHELAHRQVAKYYGLNAEYRAWTTGLLFTILLPLITFGRFLFAAPGAVYISGSHITREQNGLISVAGAATNIVVAFMFLILLAVFKPTDLVSDIFSYSAMINFFLALFNLLPIGPLDGSKVFTWSIPVWGVAMAIAAIGVFAPWIYFLILQPIF